MFLFTNIEHVIITLSIVKIYVKIGHMSTCILLVMIRNIMNFKHSKYMYYTFGFFYVIL